jgi:leucine dehydrogenase
MGTFQQIKDMGHEQVVFCQEPSLGLKAIIAIHDTTLGPSLGGCRFWDYKNEQEALVDVLRLSRGMSYKAAVAGLSLGGGKSVIIGDPNKLKSKEFFRAFGKFIDGLGGRYISAEDVNMSVADINDVAKETRFVVGGTSSEFGSGDPSPFTALGVYCGIKASAKFRLGKDSLSGLKIAVQGCGAVGEKLCKLLHQDGVKLYISDINKDKVIQIAQAYNAKIVETEKVHQEDVDIFSPCALGGGLNLQTIPEIKAKIIAGGANNQLLEENQDGKLVQEQNILYAPDYVINAGGLINVYQELKGYDKEKAKVKTTKIYDTLIEIFAESEKKNIPTHQASNLIAEQRIAKARAQARECQL